MIYTIIKPTASGKLYFTKSTQSMIEHNSDSFERIRKFAYNS